MGRDEMSEQFGPQNWQEVQDGAKERDWVVVFFWRGMWDDLRAGVRCSGLTAAVAQWRGHSWLLWWTPPGRDVLWRGQRRGKPSDLRCFLPQLFVWKIIYTLYTHSEEHLWGQALMLDKCCIEWMGTNSKIEEKQKHSKILWKAFQEEWMLL